MKVVLCAVALFLCAPAWAINKCTGADGKVVFQDAACEGRGEKMVVRSTQSAPASTAATTPDWQRDAVEVDKRAAILEAIGKRVAVVGMNGAQLEQAMGLPNRINFGEYKTGSTQQRIYERGSSTWYVYTDEKFVTAVQMAATPGASTQALPCPTSHEIRDAETSASSITLTDAQRLEWAKRLRVMRSCGK